MKPIITNDSIADDLKRFIAVIQLFPDGKKSRFYYYKKTLSKKQRQTPSTIISAIEAYQGSPKGANIPSDKFMDDWKNSTRAPEITILKQNPKANEIGFYEQYFTTMHREYFPDDKINSKENCYNRNNAQTGAKTFGVVSHEQMMEYIAIKKLKKRKKLIADGLSLAFPKISLSRERLKEIEDADNIIQGRQVVKNQVTVAKYRGEQSKLSDLENDFNDLQIYLPENPGELEEVGDGSHCYYAFKPLLKHKEMSGNGIPYEWHRWISKTGKENMGNWFNKRIPKSKDWTKDEDILKSLRNTIIASKKVILNDKNMPNMDSPLIDEVFEDHGYHESEIVTLKGKITSEYKKKNYDEERLQGNVWNFSRESLYSKNPDLFDQESYAVWNKIMEDVIKRFPKYKSNVKRVGETKTKEDTFNHIIKSACKTDGQYPTHLLVVVWTSTIKSYQLHKNGNELKEKQYIKNLIKPTIPNIEIVVINPEKNTEESTFFVVPELTLMSTIKKWFIKKVKRDSNA